MYRKSKGDKMTKEEASKRYQIPISILNEYESWGLCGAVKKVMGAWQYDDTDLERLSTIMSLHDMGFDVNEVETYMRLLLSDEDTERERLDMLNKKRGEVLNDIHFKERQIARMDYLKYCIEKDKNN